MTARSRPCQNRCTGLVLPLNQPLNSSNTESDQSRIRPKRAIASRSQDAWSTILRERRRHRHAERLLLDLHVDPELAEQRVEAGIELRDGQSVAELERLRATVGRSHGHGVIDEVEGDLERRVVVMQPSRLQPAHVDVERDVPPVVARRVVARRIFPMIWL